MADDWKCGRCGGSAYEHSRPDSTCIWEPVPNEPTMQVPASLIERAAELLDKHHPGITSARLRALFPQPTPSAEPCARCGHDVEQHGEPVTAGGIGCALLSCPCGWFVPTIDAPPSIAEMAPGTTFTDADGRRLTFAVNPWGVKYAVTKDRREVPLPDPSTIRDVTPPESPNVN